MSATDAASRLRAAIDEPGVLYQIVPALTRGRRFVGWVSPTAFDIRVRRTGANSLAPHARGSFIPTEKGCLVEVHFGPSELTRRGLAALILLVGISAPLPLLSVGYPWPVAVGVLLICVAVSMFVFRARTDDRGFPSNEAVLLEDFVRATLSEPRGQVRGSSVDG